MSDRPTISVYLDDCIVDFGYYRNWPGVDLLEECCELAARLDGCASYRDVQARFGKLSEDCGSPPCPEPPAGLDPSDRDARATQMFSTLAREGGHYPDEQIMLELEGYSEFPVYVDLTRRCFYRSRSFLADGARVVGWREWVGEQGAGYYGWPPAGLAASFDDAAAISGWLEDDGRAWQTNTDYVPPTEEELQAIDAAIEDLLDFLNENE